MEQQVAALEAKLANVSVDANNDLFISGVNLFIQSGNGATDADTNAKGNLIIGYNEDDFGPYNRTGSHNLIVGPEHSYSSFGGLVAGLANTVSGQNASVTGGVNNTASAPCASVSGGQDNTAMGTQASVSGGISNTAMNLHASVSGGKNCTIAVNDAWGVGDTTVAAGCPTTS